MRRLFAQDRLGFMIDGSAGRAFFRKESARGKAADADLLPAPLPLGATGVRLTRAGNHCLAVTQQSRLPEQSFAFINHVLASRDLARELYEQTGMIPARESLLAMPEYQEPYAKLLYDLMRNVHHLPTQAPWWSLAMVFLGDGLARCLQEQVDPAPILEETVRAIQTLQDAPDSAAWTGAW